MKQHTYEVTLKHMTDAQGNPSTYTETLSFNSYNHDDIFKVLVLKIVFKTSKKSGFGSDKYLSIRCDEK